MKKLFIASLLLLSNMVLAEPMMTCTCDQPKGVRTEYGVSLNEYFDAHMEKRPEAKPSFKEPKPDAFINKPTFIVDSGKTKMTVVWSESDEDIKSRKESRKQGLPTVAPSQAAIEMNIVGYDENVITAIEERAFGATTYSLFPKLGMVFITSQGLGPNMNNAVQMSTFAFCEFSATPGR